MELPQVQANIFAGRALLLGAQKVSASLDSFSGWLVAGFGAAFALFIANLDTLSKFIPVATIGYAAALFLASAVLAVFAKLVGVFVSAGTAAGTEGAALGKDLAAQNIKLDVVTFFSQMERALYWPANLFARRAFAKASSGDFAGPGRMHTKAAQLHAGIVIIQSVLSLAAAVVLLCGLAG